MMLSKCQPFPIIFWLALRNASSPQTKAVENLVFTVLNGLTWVVVEIEHTADTRNQSMSIRIFDAAIYDMSTREFAVGTKINELVE